MGRCGIECREQILHLESGGIEWTPYTTDVVTHIFEEMDSLVLMAAGELRFDEEAANVHDCGGRPRELRVTGVPELSKEPLRFIVRIDTKWGIGEEICLLQELLGLEFLQASHKHYSAVQLADPRSGVYRCGIAG